MMHEEKSDHGHRKGVHVYPTCNKSLKTLNKMKLILISNTVLYKTS